MTQEPDSGPSRVPTRKAAATSTAPKTVAQTNQSITPTAPHGPDVAADALPWFTRAEWDDAIQQEAKTGNEFAADTLQEKYNLPSLGQGGAGGIFMGAHRAGIIRKTGYRASDKPSRAGSVVTTWIGCGDAA